MTTLESYHNLGIPFLDVMVLNDIIEQAAGRHSRASDHGGEKSFRFCRDSCSLTINIDNFFTKCSVYSLFLLITIMISKDV